MLEKNLLNVAEAARVGLLKAAKTLQNLGVFLETIPDAAFVKTVDGSLVAINSHYDAIYGRGQTTAGRQPHNYLSASLLVISQNSDVLLKHGCAYVLFEHTLGGPTADRSVVKGAGEHRSGQEMLLRTVKVSLLGSGQAGWLCLGLTRRLKPLPPDRVTNIRLQWQRYERLTPRERVCFQLLGQGKKTADIASELEIDPKTVARLRKELREKFDVHDPIGLTQLLVRFHDAGYIDFGLE